MIRIGIVGCGKIADQHAHQIRRIPDCRIVAACDREPLMAHQFAERFDVPDIFCDLDAMLKEAKPDVVHVTTPPHAHFESAERCLEAGAHVYLEKPFTINADEAERLIALAESRALTITVGHNVQFSRESRIMRDLVRRGFLGGPPVHMESLYCYDLGDSYGRAFLSDRGHWLRRLPGKLLHNLISHGIAKISEFLPDEAPEVIAHAFTSPGLQERGEREILDELRVIISGKTGITAYFTFSSRIRPRQNQFRIYGPENSLIVDQVHRSVIRVENRSCKAQLNYILPPLRYAGQYRGNAGRNIRDLFRHDLHLDSGMKQLIEAFYRSVADGAPPPIPYREILLTARIMDSIFRQTVPLLRCEVPDAGFRSDAT